MRCIVVVVDSIGVVVADCYYCLGASAADRVMSRGQAVLSRWRERRFGDGHRRTG